MTLPRALVVISLIASALAGPARAAAPEAGAERSLQRTAQGAKQTEKRLSVDATVVPGDPNLPAQLQQHLEGMSGRAAGARAGYRAAYSWLNRADPAREGSRPWWGLHAGGGLELGALGTMTYERGGRDLGAQGGVAGELRLPLVIGASAGMGRYEGGGAWRGAGLGVSYVPSFSLLAPIDAPVETHASSQLVELHLELPKLREGARGGHLRLSAITRVGGTARTAGLSIGRVAY